jgi:prepilin-type N-terminal cleavage/methylation domain-containing protein
MKSKTGFTLIEVLAAMAVLVILVLALTRMFMQAADITKRGNTALMRNSTGETALETLLQDAESMMVNERLACYVEADVTDPNGFGFDDVWFISTSGDQDDHMPYEYNHFFVTNRIATNAMGAAYMRFDLMKARMIFAVGDNNGFYALDPNFVDWWKHAMTSGANWDLQTLAEHVVRFDIYVQGWDGRDWMEEEGGVRIFDSTLGPKKIADGAKYINIPPAAFDIYMQITSADVAAEAGMALMSPETAQMGREMMVRESAAFFGRAVPVAGAAQYNRVINYGTNNVAYYHD